MSNLPEGLRQGRGAVSIERTTRTVIIEGIEILVDGRPVFVSQETLTELGELDRWASHFGRHLTIDTAGARALVQEGLAERETRGGIHRTQKLMELLTEWGWL